MANKTETKETTLANPRRETTLEKLAAKRLDLRSVSFEDLERMAEADGEFVDASDLGEGFQLVQGISGKKKLVDMPFIIIDHKRQKSTKVPGTFYSTMRIKTATGDLLIVNDGSTGIHAQLEQYREQGIHGMIKCRHGLQVSEDYEVKDDEGNPVLNPATNKPILGTTFYLNTSV